MKKRVVAILMATVVAVGSLAGCGSKGGNGGEASTEGNHQGLCQHG